jgi:DMSO/TMAO reductase YedYZ molybdopterin-dependent catalytic subunit
VSARVTNLTLFAALLVVFATGVGAVASGTARGAWIVVTHGIAGLLVVLLIPSKLRVIRAGLRQARHTRWLSLGLAALAVTALLAGIGHTTGLVRSVGGVDGLWLHIAVALALVPLLLWHLAARWVRPRRTDASRRTLLRAAALTTAAAGVYGAAELAGLLPGARRRFTGSYERGSFEPARMPNTIWLNDTVPLIDGSAWRLTVVGAGGGRELTLDDLRTGTVTRRALLDCTSGWYAEQDWTGVPVADLIPTRGDARSLLVHSHSGYWVRLPIEDFDHLLLATGVAGRPLSPGHGYPARLVAPGRRGFWWVKWVDRIELSSAPPWWQPPFPVT